MTTPLPVGCRVRKVLSKSGDAHADGAEGSITSVFGCTAADGVLPDGSYVPAGTYGYFVQWDDVPLNLPIFVMGTRVEPVAGESAKGAN
jgi:hypothetical protein